MNYPQKITSWLLDTVFPIKCISCGRFSSRKGGYLCKKCTGLIPINPLFKCIGCNRKTILGKTCNSCRDTNAIDQLLVVSDYGNPLTVKLIKSFKYRFVREMILPISLILRKYILRLNSKNKFNILQDNPLIIPVPLYRYRLNWRGFNQAELIAQSLAEITNCDIAVSALLRKNLTKPQADIEERGKRLENIKKAFGPAGIEPAKNRTVILADDVCTTGATLNECAGILKEYGASKIIGLVIARG